MRELPLYQEEELPPIIQQEDIESIFLISPVVWPSYPTPAVIDF